MYNNFVTFRPKVDSPDDIQHSIEHGEPTSPRCYFSQPWIPHVQSWVSFHAYSSFLRIKEQQIHIERIDLVWANWRIDLGAKRPDTVTVPTTAPFSLNWYGRLEKGLFKTDLESGVQ